MSTCSHFNFSDNSDITFYEQSLSIWDSDYANDLIDSINLSSQSQSRNFSPWPMDIHTAASIGLVDWIQENIGKDCNRKNLGGWTPLMYACHAGYLGVAKFLINCQDCRVNELNSQGHTPLILAANCGNEDLVEALLEKGAELESADIRGQTALYHATISGHHTVVRLLVDKGANYNVTDFQTEMTPFTEAVAAANEVLVQYFLYKGVDLGQRNSQGLTAIEIANHRGHTKISKMIQDYIYTFKKVELQRINRSESGITASKNKDSKHITNGPVAINNILNKLKKQPTQNQLHIKPMGQVQAMAHQLPQRNSPSALPPPVTMVTNSMATVAVDSNILASQFTNLYANNEDSSKADLKQLLSEIGLAKYHAIFEEQDVDMVVFLTLDDKDLRELGINLLGPRKKIMLAISRWQESISQQRSSRPHDNQDANRCRQLALQLMQAEQSIKKLSQDLQREEKLRSLVENCLITERSANQNLFDSLVVWRQQLFDLVVALRSKQPLNNLEFILEGMYKQLDNLIEKPT